MGFQSVPDTVEITVVFEQNFESLTNSCHADKPGGYSLTDLQNLADAVDLEIATTFLPVMTEDCSYVRTEVRGLDTENDLFADADAGAGPGEQLVEGLPNNVTLSLKKVSGLTGRSARGRWYFIGMKSTSLASNENKWQDVDVDARVAALESLRAVIEATVWSPVIVSRFTAGAARAEGKRFPWLSVVAVNSFVDSQRGRLTR